MFGKIIPEETGPEEMGLAGTHLEHVMTEHPLSGLTEALAAGDVRAASVLVNRAPWTNLATALSVLPETDRRTAYRLLLPAVADEVHAQLSEAEQAALRRARNTPDPHPG